MGLKSTGALWAARHRRAGGLSKGRIGNAHTRGRALYGRALRPARRPAGSGARMDGHGAPRIRAQRAAQAGRAGIPERAARAGRAAGRFDLHRARPVRARAQALRRVRAVRRSDVGGRGAARQGVPGRVHNGGAAHGGVEPRECAMYDDMAPALRAARAAGMYAVGVYDAHAGTARAELEAAADEFIESFDGRRRAAGRQT